MKFVSWNVEARIQTWRKQLAYIRTCVGKDSEISEIKWSQKEMKQDSESTTGGWNSQHVLTSSPTFLNGKCQIVSTEEDLSVTYFVGRPCYPGNGLSIVSPLMNRLNVHTEIGERFSAG